MWELVRRNQDVYNRRNVAILVLLSRWQEKTKQNKKEEEEEEEEEEENEEEKNPSQSAYH